MTLNCSVLTTSFELPVYINKQAKAYISFMCKSEDMCSNYIVSIGFYTVDTCINHH